MLLRKFVSSALVFIGLGLAVSAQAAVVPAVGAMQGTAIFATNNGSLEQDLQPRILAGAGQTNIHPILGTPARPVANAKSTDDHTNFYAMLGLGLLGLMVARRKRYGRK
ncbi:hypothetical protein K4H28_15100 [Deefgea tanakiae]|jgi:hypothetical protein|uniref:LPXTG cell wall anchor domain-containing protein n=1 Tax=Deefgea tanakiae TaxID=2865840 RepID=A0ABX8Z5H9_9NEIS|nr:hypothetical protein [Deefgea tanakiae]QZA77582.1 hypothetical protein K4H28_15100 [Deefgea tanakiae]